MVSEVLRTLRERLTVRHFVPHVAVLVVFYGVTRDVETLIALTLGLGIVESIDVLRETPSIDDRWIQVGIGAFVTVGSFAWFGYELTVASDTGGPAWFPALLVFVGLWFLLDARRDFREGRRRSAPEEMDANDVMLVLNHAHLVTDELRSGPKTVPELADRCDLTESRVREAIDVAIDEDIVYPVGGTDGDEPERYALDESQLGGVAFVRSNAKRVLRRLARPFRR